MSIEGTKMTLQTLIMLDNNVLSDFEFDFLGDGVLADELLIKTYERPLLSTVTPEYFKLRCRHFINSHYSIYKRIVDALNLEYNILDNYDRTESITVIGTGLNSQTNVGANNIETTEQISAEDSETFVNQGKTTSDTSTGASSSEDYSNTTTTTSHVHGNIGVMTSTEMQKKYIDFYREHNIYSMIVEDFIYNSELWYYFFT